MQYDPLALFETKEEVREFNEEFLCHGAGFNSIISALLVVSILSKSQNEKVIQILEAGNNNTAYFGKAMLYTQLSIGSMLSFMTFLYMAEDPDAATCLSNLAGLLVLNDFDNIIGYVFERRVNLKFPKLQMVDELLKDEFHV